MKQLTKVIVIVERIKVTAQYLAMTIRMYMYHDGDWTKSLI